MEQVSRYQIIHEEELDQEYYFQSLFREICIKQLLTDTQIEKIQMDLIQLIAKEVERYTNDESSSIPMEKAQELLQSITYSIGYYLKSMSSMEEKLNVLKEEQVSSLFYKGMEAVSMRKVEANQILQYLLKDPLKVENYSYQDTTITGLPEFFHDYNIEFGAHLMPGSIDYPIINPVTGLLGVEYIYRYLHCMKLEYDFLKGFSSGAVNELLYNFSKESEHLLLNIFELVLINVLGCVLLGNDVFNLHLRKEEIRFLQNYLEKYDQIELEKLLMETLIERMKVMELSLETENYILAVIPQISNRIWNNLRTNTLDKVFISVREVPNQGEYLEEGSIMEDSQLRNLVEEINAYPTVLEKVSIIQRSVRSISDLSLLMDECFYDGEYKEVLETLGETECNVLKKFVLNEIGIIDPADFEPEKEWHKTLFMM